jgi:hypothetical protein
MSHTMLNAVTTAPTTSATLRDDAMPENKFFQSSGELDDLFTLAAGM